MPVRAVADFVLEQFPLARQDDVTNETSLIEQGIVDSLGILELVTFIETEFCIVLDDDEMVSDHFNSIASLARLVGSKLGDPQTSATDV